jgi:hypothetical protein
MTLYGTSQPYKISVMPDQYEKLVQCLKRFSSKQWINQYFDLQKKLLEDLGIENSDPRLALTLSQDKLPMNLGQRYIIKPQTKSRMLCIAPVYFEAETVGGKCIWQFTDNKILADQLIEIEFPVGAPFPLPLYNACLEACTAIMQKSKKSGYRKYHSPLLYHFTMEPAVRNELLNEF